MFLIVVPDHGPGVCIRRAPLSVRDILTCKDLHVLFGHKLCYLWLEKVRATLNNDPG